MTWRTTLAPLFAALLGLAVLPAHADPAAQQLKARRQFQHDLVSVLALRAEPKPLLGAALLARAGDIDHGGPLDFHHLITRAAKAEGAGPAENWVRLSDCDAEADNCPNPDALSALSAQAPDNAAVWLLRMGQAAHDGHAKDTETALQKAAEASQYDDYTGQSLQALAIAVMQLPPPPATLSGQGSQRAQVADLQMALVYGIGDAQPLPGFHLAAAQCLPKVVKEQPDRRATCLKLAHVLVWGSSPLARSLGLHLQSTLAADDATRQKADAAMRDLTWQVQHFGQLEARARTDPELAQRMLMLARQGGTQMSLMQAALRGADVPLEAPSGWSPRTTPTETPQTSDAP
ncbi:hypothetical protein [Oleiagrimonas soli]|uniref:Imelysin-like domain-containing protein n=1 Tax=Oleiagrimonas soli TaxID=1543381 RepID=A0A841KQF3_9GAMM|nr:hypothetical protein [Oleiagrimonas soli]MBB6184881.1 hypothetical protein [Oleiagrimonas soli]